jgi:RNA polymerase sigma factor (sigma-70 family)
MGVGMSDSWETWSSRRALAVREASRVLRQRDDAEDCAHDALLAALDRPELLDGARREEGWLTVVARRRAVDHIRRQTRAGALVHSFSDPDERLAPDFCDDIASRLAAQVLAEDIAELPPGTQSVLRQLAGGGTTADAALALGITKRSADSHLHRARRHLRDRWMSALAALTGAFALARRPARGAAVALVATPVALLLAVTQGPKAPPPPTYAAVVPAVGQPAPTTAERDLAAGTQAVAPAAMPIAAEVVDVPGRVHVPSRPVLRPTKRQVAGVEPAPRTSVTVTHTDDGEDTPPIEAVQRCLEQLTVSAAYVGC